MLGRRSWCIAQGASGSRHSLRHASIMKDSAMKTLSASIVLASALVLLAAIIYAKSSHKSGLSLEPIPGNPYDLSDIGGVIETRGPVPSTDSVKRLLEV